MLAAVPTRAECLGWRDGVWPACKVAAMALGALLLLTLAFIAVTAMRTLARLTRRRPR
jgi:hypothetical protein